MAQLADELCAAGSPGDPTGRLERDIHAARSGVGAQTSIPPLTSTMLARNAEVVAIPALDTCFVGHSGEPPPQVRRPARRVEPVPHHGRAACESDQHLAVPRAGG